jgi:hypothetical protein
MKPWGQCREKFHTIETQKLQRLLQRHAERCIHERDCPLRLLECVAARCICLRMRHGFEIVPWPAPKR